MKFAKARQESNHKKSNPAFDKMMRAARDIRLSHEDGGEAFFAEMLKNPMSEIVNCAAFLLIPLNPDLARRTLKSLLSDDSAEVSFAAKVTLEEWDKGSLDTDWYMVES